MLKTRPLVGYYGFWVFLTYLSVVSALFGIYFAFAGYITHAIICLMLSGIFDTFDGRVASLKKRNEQEKNYGIQIDAMADLISFGVAPAVIGYAVWQANDAFGITSAIIASAYVLAALIRLAHFNVTETESQNKNEKRKYFEGLPSTTIAVIIPLVFSICNILDAPFYLAYKIMLVSVAVLFVVRVKLPKPRGLAMLIMWLIGTPVVISLLIIGGRSL